MPSDFPLSVAFHSATKWSRACLRTNVCRICVCFAFPTFRNTNPDCALLLDSFTSQIQSSRTNQCSDASYLYFSISFSCAFTSFLQKRMDPRASPRGRLLPSLLSPNGATSVSLRVPLRLWSPFTFFHFRYAEESRRRACLCTSAHMERMRVELLLGHNEKRFRII